MKITKTIFFALAILAGCINEKEELKDLQRTQDEMTLLLYLNCKSQGKCQ